MTDLSFFSLSQREVIDPLLYGVEHSYLSWIRELQQALKYSAKPDRVQDGVKVHYYMHFHVFKKYSTEARHIHIRNTRTSEQECYCKL